MASSAMYEDLGIAAPSTKPSLAELATLSVKSSLQGAPDAPPMSSRRRPRPPTLVRGVAPADLPMTPRPPLAPLPPGASPRPSSVPRLGSAGERANLVCSAPMSKSAAAADAADAEMLRMRFAMAELQGKCDRQSQEMARLRQQVNVGDAADIRVAEMPRDVGKSEIAGVRSTSPSTFSVATPRAGAAVGISAARCEQECQTDEQVFDAQVDFIHREAALKGKELRKLQETVRLLRAELKQEKLVSEQYRDQVEGLETQLQSAMVKQHRAEGERSLVEWRLRNAEGAGRPSTQGGRLSRGCTPQPASSQNRMNAWTEPGRMLDDGDRMASGGREEHDGTESESAAENNSVDSDGSEDIEVFHPPPSRHGLRH